MPRFRSQFELKFASSLALQKIEYEYEKHKIKYQPPEKTYTPDFYLKKYDFYIETKGRFLPSDRTKHLLIKKQHPELDIRFVFMNANQRLSKKSKTTYAAWCDRHGFKWAEGFVPKEWLQ